MDNFTKALNPGTSLPPPSWSRPQVFIVVPSGVNGPEAGLASALRAKGYKVTTNAQPANHQPDDGSIDYQVPQITPEDTEASTQIQILAQKYCWAGTPVAFQNSKDNSRQVVIYYQNDPPDSCSDSIVPNKKSGVSAPKPPPINQKSSTGTLDVTPTEKGVTTLGAPLASSPQQTLPQQNAPPQSQAAPQNINQADVTKKLISPDGKLIASVMDTHSLIIQHTDGEGNAIRPDLTFVSPVLAWSPDSTELAVGSADRVDIISTVGSGSSRTLEGGSAEMISVAWSPDRKRLAAADSKGTIFLWDPPSGKMIRKISTPKPIKSIAWNSDSRHLEATYDDGTTASWDIVTGTQAPHPPTGLGAVVQ
jgi:WD40 repeat protein